MDLDEMEAAHEAFVSLCADVPVIAALEEGATLECTTWQEDPPPNSDRIIVESIFNLLRMYEEERVTMQSLVDARREAVGRVNCPSFEAREAVLDLSLIHI